MFELFNASKELGTEHVFLASSEQDVSVANQAGVLHEPASWFGMLVYMEFFSWWKLLLILLVVTNVKHIPFVYHLRILNAVRFVLRSQRPAIDIQPHQLFQALITSSRSCLMDMDVYGHKSNSTYFIDVDIGRAHLITTVFGKGIAKIRGSTTMNGLSGKTASKFSVAMGGVSCTFRKELRPYESYDVWSRVLSWDNKWLYIVSHFVKKGSKLEPEEYTLYPQQGLGDANVKVQKCEPTTPRESVVVASALSKVVFKDGRKTISPETMLEMADLLPPKGALREAVEEQRTRGMCSAELLAHQTSLEGDFQGQVALGRHHDGLGIEGVIATFAQLGGVSRRQLI